MIDNRVINMERTFTYLKPDAIEKKLVGKIIDRMEKEGFKIIRLKKGMISKELAMQLYPDSEEQLVGMGQKTLKAMTDAGKSEKVMEIFNTEDPRSIGMVLNQWNRSYATSTEIIAMVLESDNAVAKLRSIIGKTDPAIADKGTIRGDFSDDSIMNGNMEKRACKNLIHASDGDRAEVEIGLFEKNFF